MEASIVETKPNYVSRNRSGRSVPMCVAYEHIGIKTTFSLFKENTRNRINKELASIFFKRNTSNEKSRQNTSVTPLDHTIRLSDSDSYDVDSIEELPANGF